ncbi:hypothetical protein CC78DRAFT_564583 [Lojkania enalia]|uniref:Uncharacterized protein n=1 Tax=Lojkania enalia TaxID=147567 RepID=A0A9P4NB22_9PLEO|nr:hypothetical protein CC78DRAFT_564583 [Didymosphaeria enalia]
MPPRVARHCHVPSLLRSATRLPLCPRPPEAPACGASFRQYASKSPKTFSSKSFKPNSAIIIPASAAGATPEAVIERIRPLHPDAHGRQRLAVLLLTPAFASWAKNDDGFIKPALERMFAPIFALDGFNREVRALIAVIDKLPTPGTIPDNRQDKSAPEVEVSKRVRSSPIAGGGNEGIAYTVLKFSAETQLPHTGPESERTITFVNAAWKQENGKWYSDAVQLPLANTIFQTGTQTTMRYTQWLRKEESLKLAKANNTPTFNVRLRIETHDPANKRSALAIPLIPLTFPRLVEESMGNILRRVTGPDNKSMTASQELESIVPQYFKCRGEPSQPMTVWALLIPKETHEFVLKETNRILGQGQSPGGTNSPDAVVNAFSTLWKSEPPLWNDLVGAAIAKGARLHRVLSGGGGWGKKAGLLSLDPSFRREESMKSQKDNYASTGTEDAPDLLSALHTIVHPEDSIQFFVSPSSIRPGTHPDNVQYRKLDKLSKRQWNFEFGTIPSTADSLQNGSSEHTNDRAPDYLVFRNRFGALTEGPMTLKREVRLKESDLPKVIGGTNVDVPHTRLSYHRPDTGFIDESIVPKVDRSELPLHRTFLEPTPSCLDGLHLNGSASDSNAPAFVPVRRVQSERSNRPNKVLNSAKSRRLRADSHRTDTHRPQVQSTTAALADLRKYLRQILASIRHHSPIVQLTNKSAINVYRLHIMLRWCLGSMIMDRRTQPLHPLIETLEECFTELRGFNKILFAPAEIMDKIDIRNKLYKLELKHRFMRSFMLRGKAMDGLPYMYIDHDGQMGGWRWIGRKRKLRRLLTNLDLVRKHNAMMIVRPVLQCKYIRTPRPRKHDSMNKVVRSVPQRKCIKTPVRKDLRRSSITRGGIPRVRYYATSRLRHRRIVKWKRVIRNLVARGRAEKRRMELREELLGRVGKWLRGG